MTEFFINFGATVLGGLSLGLIAFLWKERIHPLPNIDGRWILEQTSHKSEYKPFVNLTITYMVLLARNGLEIYGSAEKIKDRTESGDVREYVGENRTRSIISGHIERNYLKRNRIFIHVEEHGEKRISSTFHTLGIENNNNLEGRFTSTIANQEGVVRWIKNAS